MKTEPVLILGAIDAIIVLAVSFGLSLSPEQTAAILSLVTIILSIIARHFVTPTAKLPSAGKTLGTMVFVVALTGGSVVGCTPAQRAVVADVLVDVSRGADWLGSAIDVASSASETYFARHPSQETESRVSSALHRARLGHELLSAALAGGDSLDDARAEALAAYRALYELLSSLGVLDALAPAGGAESEGAPLPVPVRLPTPNAIAERLVA